MKRRAGFTLVELLVALFITAIMFTIGYRALDQAFTSRKQLEEQSARLIAVQQAMRAIEQDFELLQPRPVRNLIGDGYLPAVLSAPNLGGLAAPGGATSTVIGSTTTFISSSPTSGSSGTTLGNSSSTLGNSGSTLGSSGSTLGNPALNGSMVPLLTFTRGGWTNPAGLPRSELQRVSYSIENGALMRSYSMELDSTAADAPIKRKLVDRVRSFTVRFMDAGHQWQTQWPPITAGAQQSLTLHMRPVAIEITLELEDWGILMRHIEVPG
ncbi:MAG: type II secretion system minor pseudopilin GspJ [Steroidobacteraceae bacterium]|jgi:prepilin-type N-terminal cleavage/methylation domain-containing protein